MPAVHEEPIDLGDLTEKNVGQLKLLNKYVFPVHYNDQFYENLFKQAAELTKLAYYGDVLVGAVCCRVEKTESESRLYIMTLGVLSPYRRLGIGKKLLEYVLNTVTKKHPILSSVYLHVQISNDQALNFYNKFNFKVVDTINNYYKKIDPPHCHVLEKKFETSSASASISSASATPTPSEK